MIDTESTSDTAALDTANLSSNSIVAKEPRASLMEMIQTLETKVTTALRDLEQEDAQFTARLTQLSDKIESYKRNLNKFRTLDTTDTGSGSSRLQQRRVPLGEASM